MSAKHSQTELIAFIEANEELASKNPAIAQLVKAAKRKLKISLDEER
jgi:hypothetical protein